MARWLTIELRLDSGIFYTESHRDLSKMAIYLQHPAKHCHSAYKKHESD